MIIDDKLNIKDTVFITGRHKHEERWSLMICRPLRTWYFLSERDTHEKRCSKVICQTLWTRYLRLEYTNIKNDNHRLHVEHWGHGIYIWNS